jgi:hypothetical protein
MFLTEHEILEHLFLYVLSEDAKRAFRKIPSKNDLFLLHGSMGWWICNRYKLWDAANPYTSQDPTHRNYPETISARIIEAVWTRMQ